MMWSASNIDLRNVGLVLEQYRKPPCKFEPTPYTFTKLENGKKTTAETNCFTPPTWLMLDHAIAVIWSLFGQKTLLHQLTIDDLKWAYEFLKQIKNKKGENPPDVKVCLKEIQDRLILLYARLTSLQDEDFDEIAAAFGEKILADATSNCLSYSASKAEMKSLSPSRTSSACLMQKQPLDVSKSGNGKPKKIPASYLSQTYPILENEYESSIFEEQEDVGDEEIEKYILTLFNDEKKQESVQFNHNLHETKNADITDLVLRPNPKSMIPTAKKLGTGSSQSNLEQDIAGDATNKEKTTKKVHCVAEMRSLKFQKSTKVQDNGEEAAYSNLKAEIRRLTINPNVSRDQIMKFLKDWRSEQVDRLHNELKRLNSIEEFMKNLSKDEVEPSLRSQSPLSLKEIKTTKTSFSRTEKIFTNSFQN